MNPLSPDRMAPSERLAEVTRLLALGLVRLRARQSSQVSELTRESPLHLRPLRLTLLAPDIVEAILDGRQPVSCSWISAGGVSAGVGRATRHLAR